jgi:hypothetical protein
METNEVLKYRDSLRSDKELLTEWFPKWMLYEIFLADR